MRSLIALLVFLTACQYAPTFVNCEIACETSSGCPSDMTCQDKVCRYDTGACGSTGPDGSDRPDGSVYDGRVDAGNTDAPPGVDTWDGTYAVTSECAVMAANVTTTISGVDDDGNGTARFRNSTWDTSNVPVERIAANQINVATFNAGTVGVTLSTMTRASPGKLQGMVQTTDDCTGAITFTK